MTGERRFPIFPLGRGFDTSIDVPPSVGGSDKNAVLAHVSPKALRKPITSDRLKRYRGVLLTPLPPKNSPDYDEQWHRRWTALCRHHNVHPTDTSSLLQKMLLAHVPGFRQSEPQSLAEALSDYRPIKKRGARSALTAAQIEKLADAYECALVLYRNDGPALTIGYFCKRALRYKPFAQPLRDGKKRLSISTLSKKIGQALQKRGYKHGRKIGRN
jgi:hypothetical protein